MKSIKIFNGTAHDINIVEGAEYSPEIRKWTGGEVCRTIPRDTPLNMHIDSFYVRNVAGIPIFRKRIAGIRPLPEGYDIYVVSTGYAMAHGQTEDNKIYVVSDTVVDQKTGRILGCRGLQLYEPVQLQ